MIQTILIGIIIIVTIQTGSMPFHRTGYLQDHTLSLTGGGEKAKYFASVGYFDQKGITLGTDLQRINTRINLDYTVSDKIKFFTSIAYTHTDQSRNYLGSSSSE